MVLLRGLADCNTELGFVHPDLRPALRCVSVVKFYLASSDLEMEMNNNSGVVMKLAEAADLVLTNHRDASFLEQTIGATVDAVETVMGTYSTGPANQWAGFGVSRGRAIR